MKRQGTRPAGSASARAPATAADSTGAGADATSADTAAATQASARRRRPKGRVVASRYAQTRAAPTKRSTTRKPTSGQPARDVKTSSRAARRTVGGTPAARTQRRATPSRTGAHAQPARGSRATPRTKLGGGGSTGGAARQVRVVRHASPGHSPGRGSPARASPLRRTPSRLAQPRPAPAAVPAHLEDDADIGVLPPPPLDKRTTLKLEHPPPPPLPRADADGAQRRAPPAVPPAPAPTRTSVASTAAEASQADILPASRGEQAASMARGGATSAQGRRGRGSRGGGGVATGTALAALPLPDLKAMFFVSDALLATWQLANAKQAACFAAQQEQAETQLFRLWTSRRVTRLGVTAGERNWVLRQGILRLDEMIKAQERLCDEFAEDLDAARRSGDVLNRALEDMLSWLPATDVHFESAQALKDALTESAAALRDAHNLLECDSSAGGGSQQHGSQAQASASGASTVATAFELVRSIATTAADAERELQQALAQLRRARRLETQERSARVQAIQQLAF